MFENSEVADTWKHELLGGKKEFDLLIQYGFKVESQLMKDLREQNSLDNLRYLAVALARLRRAYELETNSEKLLNGFDVQGLNPWVVADFKYQMNVLEDTDDSEFIQYALTQGNEFSDPQVPEFLSFHPSASSVSAVFERLRKLLESKELLIRPGQVIEITGILGLLGEVPIRVSLLNKTQLMMAHSKFVSGRSIYYPVILVDIPDTRGYFAWEQGAQDYVCKHFQNDYLPDPVSPGVTEFDAPLSPPRPSSPMAIYDCLSCYIWLSQDPASQDDEDEEEGVASPPSLATLRVLLNLLDDMHPDCWDYEGTPEEIADEHIENCCNNIKNYLVPKRAAYYVLNELLDGYDEKEPDPYIADIWRLPPPEEIPPDIADKFPPVSEWGDFYPGKQELLLDVDWLLVKRIVSAAYEDSTDPGEVEACRQINESREEAM